MHCPVDQTPLVRKVYEETIVTDWCNTCGGVWLDKGELEAIQDIIVNDYTEELKHLPDFVGKSILLVKAKDVPSPNCPVCDRTLERREYGFGSQVMIDACINGHGVWLDKNELKDLEIFYERSRLEITSIRKGFLKGLLDSL